MRILVLNYEFPPIGGGGATVSYDICRVLASRGHSISVVTMGYKNLPKHEIISGFDVYRVPCLRTKQFVCHPWEQLTYIISSILFIKKYLKGETFDVVHAHFIIPTGIVASYVKKKFGIDYILTAHGSDVPGHNNKRFGMLYRFVLPAWRRIVRDSNYVVALSEPLKNLILTNSKSLYINDKVHVIPNGIDTSIYHSAKKSKIILLMGRIQETKGMQDILNACDSTFLKEWKIEIVGDGPYRRTLEEIVKKKKIEDKVVFSGWIEAKSEEQLTILSRAGIFVSGSYVENSPVTIPEAYCSGCRILVSNISAHKSVMGENASYFRVGDIDDIRTKLAQQMEMFSANIGEVVERNKKIFDWENRVDEYEKLLIWSAGNE